MNIATDYYKHHIFDITNIIEKQINTEQAQIVEEKLFALFFKIKLANYHKKSCFDILDSLFGPSETRSENASKETAKLIIRSAEPSQSGLNIRYKLFEAEANLIASTQATHSLFDILAHIIKYSLSLNSLKPNEISFHKIIKSIEKENYLNKFSFMLTSIKCSDEYKYLSSYVNTTKHIGIIGARLHSNLQGKKENGLQIPKFSHHINGLKIIYNEKFVHILLEENNTKLTKDILDACIEIKKILQNTNNL